MADTTALKNRIRAAIKANDNQEITGSVLQQSLLDIVDELNGATETEASQRQNGDSTLQQSITAEKNRAEGVEQSLSQAINTEKTRAEGVEQSLSQVDTALNNLITGIKNNIDNGYVYAGIAMPSTTPVSGKVFYVAVQAGTYTNFGGTAVTEGITILKYNGASWVKEQALFTDGGVFDISAYRATGGTLATYADLTAALGTNGENIPQSLRKGGMSIKFVQSFDNNYVQFRCKTQSFSANPEDWYFEGDDTLVENPEYIKAITDGLGHLLAWIRVDGGIDWVIGVPKPVKDYVDAEIAKILNGSASTDIDGINKIIAFLDDFSTSDTLAELLATKVDKEENKSLIDSEYADGVHYIENPEFAEVKVDSEERILEATRPDGTKLFGAGIEVSNNANIRGNANITGDLFFNGADVTVIENPEFTAVWLDNDEHILFGVQTNGNFYFGYGVPRQVKDYIEQKIEELSLDEYESMVAFIGDYLNNTTLEELLSKKVDGEYVENPEFIEAKVDAEDKILEATEKDGTKLFGDDVKVLGSIDVSGASYKVVTNPEWLKAVLDADDRIICGIKADGKFVVYVADFLDDIEVIKVRLEELDAYSVTESPEFMDVELDADDKVLGGRKADGTKFENNDVELNGNATVGGSLKVDGVVIKNIEDPDGRHEIILDSENKIISYRRDDGTKVENVSIETPKVSTNSLELTEQGMTEFQQALKDAGFQPGGAGDWSDYISNDGKNPLQLPIPQIAKINFICDIASLSDLSKADRPDGQEGVNYDVPSYAEYWDTLGNYFKKPSKISGQGNSTMNDPMRSIAMDLFDSDDFDNAFAIKFGDWVAQDSFHVKAYYKDVTKGVSTISYKIGEVITKFLDARANRLSKNIFNISAAGGSGKAEYDYSTNALCHPDGFPVEVYHNGNYYGLSVLSLKKHRMNYSMDKNDYTSVLIDNISSFKWNNGTLNWSSAEFRNPKTLYCMDGTKYDGDNPKEIIDSTSQYYDSTNKNHVKSAEMKALVLSFLTAYGDIRNEQNVATRKNMWRQHFDIENTIAYIIFSNLTYNQDGWMNNAQISIYNNKMGFNIYDCDSCLGKSWNGTIWSCSAKAIVIGPSIHQGHILFYIANDFKDEIEAAYQALRDSKIIDVNNLSQFMIDWSNRIGYEAYKKSIDTWTNSPSYSLGNLNSEYWRQIVIGTEDLPSEYDDTVPYNKGDKCRIGSDLSYNTCIFECVKNTEPGQSPLTSGSLPTGCYDSPYRYKKWFTLRINVLDTYYNYNN